jgi:phosphonate transport system substrate-binding protein
MLKFIRCGLRLVLAVCLFFPVTGVAGEKEPEVINVAMTAAFVSEKGVGVYEDISKYLEKKTGMKTRFITGLSYSAVNAMIEKGAAHLAFVCGYPYILSHDGKNAPPTKLLAAPVNELPLYKDQPKYYSYVIVHKDSPIAKFEDLKGKAYVYNDSISNSGYNMPRAKMVALGATQGFFGKILHSGSHEQSIRMIAEKQADASSVDSLVLDYALNHDEPYAKDVKIIETLGPAGVPPVVYSTSLPKATVDKLRAALLDMKNDPEGQAILKKANLSKFVTVDDSNYDDVRKMAKDAEAAGFMEIK